MSGRHRQAALMAAGVLAAGLAPGATPALPARSRTREQRIAELQSRHAWGTLTAEAEAELHFLLRKDLPNGAQLATWRAQDQERAAETTREREANKRRRRRAWGNA